MPPPSPGLANHRRRGRQGARAISDAGVKIRPYREADFDDLYRICLATGDSGGDATGLYADPKLVGHVYAGPYGRLSPEHCLVAEDAQGVAGYILGALDTPKFEALLEEAWWPGLRRLYPEPAGKPRRDWPLDDIRAWQIHHPFMTPERIAAPFPSHLHIDLLPRLQGHGLGRSMMDRWLAHIGAAGSPGVHLGVGPANARALRFYRAYGWRELEISGPTAWLGLTVSAQLSGTTPHQPGR